MRVLRRQLLLSVATLLPLAAQKPGKRVIVLVGPPGSGKTTQAEKLKASLGLPLISMADIIKKEGGGNKGYTKQLGRHIAGDDLVNDDLANALIRKRVTRKDTAKGFILDGYPATVRQAEYLDAMLPDLDLPPAAIIHLSVPDAEADKRLTARGREYDSPENIERRIVEYRAQAEVLLRRYGSAMKTVDGTKSPDAVAAEIRKVLGY